MPRGGTDEARGLLTDTAGIQQFSNVVQSQYGIHPNAEALIEAHRATRDPALQRASLLQVNAEATEEAKNDLKGSAKKLGLKDGDGELLDVTVRGNAVIGVVEYADGTVDKVVGGWDDTWKPWAGSPAEAEERASARAEADVQRQIAQLQVETQQQLADFQAELSAQAQTEIEKIREQAQKEIEKARTSAEKETSSSSGSSGSSAKRSTASRRRTTTSRRGAGRKSASKSSHSGSGASESFPDTRSSEEKKGETSGA